MNSGILGLTVFLGVGLLPIAPICGADIFRTDRAIESGTHAANVLQTDDEIVIRSLQAKELSDKTFRLDQNGEINLPLVGVVQLAGSTVRQAEAIVRDKLKRYYFEPDVAINIIAFHDEPVSVIGAVGTPGVHQIKGQTALLEVLSSAGGIRSDAGPVVVITRQAAYGPIPHPNAHQSPSGESVAELDLKSLLESRNPSENILIEPHDVISAPPAQIVYVVGNVKRAGGFPLGGKPTLSVLQALALAEGLDQRAEPHRSRILRQEAGGELQIPIDIKKILAGKAEDIQLRPNDILFVPNSAMKTVSTRTIEAAIQIGTGILIFRP
jgi:polysaccharide export outer membrane protein